MKGKFLRKILSVTMAFSMTAGIVCLGAVPASAAEVDVAPLIATNSLTNNSTISSTLISKGESVTVNAKASSGKGGYTYAVLYKKKAEKDWTVRQGYKNNQAVIVKPAKDTDYDVCAKVKDSAGTVVKKFFTLKVNPKLQNTSTISKTSIVQGEKLTVSASATGGVGKYNYAVLYKKLTDKEWTVRQGYKDNASIIVNPAKATDYSICVKVKDEHGIIAKKFFSVSVAEDISKAYIAEVFRMTNEERAKVGLPALKQDENLMKAAAQRAVEISEVFEHTRPDGRSCFTILREYNINYWGAAENIAYGYRTPEQVMNGWMNSSGHKANILNESMTHIGIGFYEKNGAKYWVQEFAYIPY